jgi:hypothetical protein
MNSVVPVITHPPARMKGCQARLLAAESPISSYFFKQNHIMDFVSTWGFPALDKGFGSVMLKGGNLLSLLARAVVGTRSCLAFETSGRNGGDSELPSSLFLPLGDLGAITIERG